MTQGHPESVDDRPALAQRLRIPGFVLGIALIVFMLADLVLPARADLFGLSQVLAPYMTLLFLPLGVMALRLRGGDRWRLGLMAAAAIALTTHRFLPGVPGDAVAVDPALPQVNVATWNLYLDAVPDATLIPALTDRAPGIVGLQELTPEAAAVIAADPNLRTRFPYQVLDPANAWTGMGLLSSWPIAGEAETGTEPPLIAATIRPPRGPELDIIVAHAPPPRFGLSPTGPSYDPGRRNASLQALRQRLQASIDADRRVVLLGDFNVTDREIGYTELASGSTDSYHAAGSGLGHTSRPPLGEGLPFGMLCIDMMLSGPGAAPVASRPDCAPCNSDHCILGVTFAVEPA